MKQSIATVIGIFMALAVLAGCASQQNPSDHSGMQHASSENTQDTSNEKPQDSHDIFDAVPPREALLNLEIMDGKFLFQRIATTPRIVYSNTPISDMSKGMVYDDRHDILTVLFQATDNKDAITDLSECEFSHYIYLYDKDHEDAPWHYRFAICSCGAVMITNNDELLCTIKITDEERQSILNALN